jgi:hypothetical protein
MPRPLCARVGAYSGGTQSDISQPLSTLLDENFAEVLVSSVLALNPAWAYFLSVLWTPQPRPNYVETLLYSRMLYL